MPLALTNSEGPRTAAAPGVLMDAYLAYVTRTGNRTDSRYRHAAQRFLDRWPDPMDWAAEPLVVRRQAQKRTRTLVTFLMLHRYLRPGYDYLLDVTLLSLWREIPESPLYDDLERFRAAARELGFTEAVSKACSCMIAARLLIQTGRPLAELTEQDIVSFEAALRERRAQTGRRIAHYVLCRCRHNSYYPNSQIMRIRGEALLSRRRPRRCDRHNHSCARNASSASVGR
jgi:hypothetical protein